MDDFAGKVRISQKPLPANARRIRIPVASVAQWLSDIDDIIELKVTLRALALLADESPRRSLPPSIELEDLLDDRFLSPASSGGAESFVRTGLAAALHRGTLVAVRSAGTIRVLLNDEGCRRYLKNAGVPEIAAADVLTGPPLWISSLMMDQTQVNPHRTNIFTLYEEVVGQYGHTRAEQLKMVEEEYPATWIEDAFAHAVEYNRRNWGYIESILKRWMREGRHEHGEPGSDSAPDSRKRDLDDYRQRYGRLPWERDDA